MTAPKGLDDRREPMTNSTRQAGEALIVLACGYCAGTGLDDRGETCDHCDGTGDEPESRQIASMYRRGE